MSFFTNKHVVIAMIAAPILAVISYLAVDRYVSPKPIPAQVGQTYPLVTRSNCRYNSGKCTLVNGDFKVELETATQAEQNTFTLNVQSEFPIQGARYALIDSQGQEIQNGSGSSSIFSRNSLQGASAMRIALNSNDVWYFAETQIEFLAGLEQ